MAKSILAGSVCQNHEFRCCRVSRPPRLGENQPVLVHLLASDGRFVEVCAVAASDAVASLFLPSTSAAPILLVIRPRRRTEGTITGAQSSCNNAIAAKIVAVVIRASSLPAHFNSWAGQ